MVLDFLEKKELLFVFAYDVEKKRVAVGQMEALTKNNSEQRISNSMHF